MNSAFLIAIVLLVLSAGYFFYGKFISKILGVDPSRRTPAHEKNDGVDYVPAKHWLVLFGHHFSSICGAGPIVGPVIAVAYWGWGISLIWILLGSVLMGAVADFSSLMVSVRHGGESISEISKKVISPRARLLFSVFIWLSLILVIAVFAILAAKTFSAQPAIVVPSVGIIPLAVVVGWLLYVKKKSLIGVTGLGLIGLALLLLFGGKVPVVLNTNLWIGLLMVYCFVASVTPVQYLLQPRDYMAGFILFGAIGLGILGVFISHKPMGGPAFAGWVPDPSLWRGAGPLWPMLFVTIACGAISGFHSLVSSGTTCKQLDSEAHACRVGYGGMLTEGLVASLVVFCVAAGLSRGELVEFLTDKSKGGPIAAFGKGYGAISFPLLGSYGTAFAIMALNAFILTTLDTATRIGRYLTSELFGIQNRYAATFIVVAVSATLALTGQWQRIWPVFGASNQLVAALALLVVSCWLLSRRKNVWITLVPALIMLATTIGAFVIQIHSALMNVDKSGAAAPQWIVALTAGVLILLAGAVFLGGDKNLSVFEARQGLMMIRTSLFLLPLLVLIPLPVFSESSPDVKILIKSLKDKNPNVRVDAAQSLGELGDKKAVKPLIKAVRKYDDVKIVGVRALGKLGDQRALDLLFELLDSDDANLVGEAARALAGFDEKKVLNVLIERLQTVDDYGCQIIVNSLRKKGVPHFGEALAQVLDNYAVRPRCAVNAADALGRLGDPKAIGPFLKNLRGPSPIELKSQILRSLGLLNAQESYGEILSYLESSQAVLRRAALEGLVGLGAKQAGPQIKGRLKDENETVRKAAEYAVKQLGIPSSPSP